MCVGPRGASARAWAAQRGSSEGGAAAARPDVWRLDRHSALAPPRRGRSSREKPLGATAAGRTRIAAGAAMASGLAGKGTRGAGAAGGQPRAAAPSPRLSGSSPVSPHRGGDPAEVAAHRQEGGKCRAGAGGATHRAGSHRSQPGKRLQRSGGLLGCGATLLGC